MILTEIYISLGENDIDRDISLAENDIDREGQQQDKSILQKNYIHKTSLCFCRDTLSLARNDIDRDISLAENDIDRDISLAENDIDRDISLAKNYIDREGIFGEAKRGFVIFETKSGLLLTLSVNNISNQREGLCL